MVGREARIDCCHAAVWSQAFSEQAQHVPRKTVIQMMEETEQHHCIKRSEFLQMLSFKLHAKEPTSITVTSACILDMPWIGIEADVIDIRN